MSDNKENKMCKLIVADEFIRKLTLEERIEFKKSLQEVEDSFNEYINGYRTEIIESSARLYAHGYYENYNEKLKPQGVYENLMTTAEAAKYLGVKTNTVTNWICTGRYPLKSIKVGRLRKFRREDLDEFLRSRERSNDK
jgi:excisionase family DNA binding protein